VQLDVASGHAVSLGGRRSERPPEHARPPRPGDVHHPTTAQRAENAAVS
jgi:hypothetical protein